MNHGRSLFGSVGWLSAGSIAARVAGVSSGVISARALGVAGRGELSLLLVVGMLAGGILPLGMDLWAATSLGRGVDLPVVKRLLVRHLATVAILVALVALPLWKVSDVDSGIVAATVLLCLTATGSTLKLGILQGLNQMKRYSLAALSSTVVFAAVLCVLVLCGAVSVVSFVCAAAVGQLVTAAWPAPDHRDVPSAPGLVSYRSAIAFGLPTAMGAVAAMLLYRADLFLVSWWDDIDAVGLYSVALAYTEVIWVIPTAAAQAVVPLAARPDSKLNTPRVSRTVVALMLLFVGIVCVTAPLLLPLVFGRQFSGAGQAIVPLAFAAVGVGVWKLVGHDLIARGDARTRLWTGVFGIVVMVLSGAVLIPLYGIAGAAFASLLAYFTSAGLMVKVWCRREGVAPSDLIVPRQSDLTDLVRRVRNSRWRTELADNGKQ